MKSYPLFIFTLFLLSTGIYSCKKETSDRQTGGYDNGPTDSLRMNEIQIIASHNSYHLKTDPEVFDFLTNLFSLGALPSSLNPSDIDYEHESLSRQLSDFNVRGFELDINNDPLGGHFYKRTGASLAGLPAESGVQELQEPGFKIIHIVDFDYNTTNYTLVSAMRELKAWSDAHPNHLPLLVNIETKDDTPGDIINIPGVGLTTSVPYDASACDKMDEEIKSVFGENLDKLITPDKIRGEFPTLREAVLSRGWPTLAESRGKIAFIMQGAAESLYKAGHPSLSGRAMFVYVDPAADEAAFIIRNNPNASDIPDLVTQGFMVRTRSDAGTDEARTGNYSGRDAAFASGAQIISTDYYRPDSRAGTPGWTDYKVQFPNGEVARINPVSAADRQNLGKIKE